MEAGCVDSNCVERTCAQGSCSNGQCVPCQTTDAPKPCGVFDSGCIETCQTNQSWGACQPPSGPVNVQTDGNNCGQCGNACPQPVNAQAACASGACGRGPCSPGTYDLDPNVFGCESTCTASGCQGSDGGTLPITAPPPPETGVTFHSFSSGSSVGSFIQTNGSFSQQAILGEGVNDATGAGASNAGQQVRSGFSAAVQ